MAFDNLTTRLRFLVFCCCFFFFFLNLLLLRKTSAQEGFVSLECCAPSNASDLDHNNITWISDAVWFPSIKACRDIRIPVSNDTSYNKARVFGSDLQTNSATKWCYNLKTVKEKDYLIRATFLHGPIMQTFADCFNVSIGATSIAQVNFSKDSLEVEGIFRASDNYSDFCLVKGKGSPYISKLELRPLQDFQYLAGDVSAVLKVISRVDVGNTGEAIRYPNDPSDRIWRTNGNYSPNSSIISLPNITVYGANASVPVQILQTALFDPNRLEFTHTDLDANDNDYIVTLYFLELDPNVRAKQRVFEIYVNGVKRADQFDILENGDVSNYREIVFKVENANGLLNFSLIKVSDVAEFGPICNAYEVLQVHKSVAGTFQGDVDAIVEVRNELQIDNRENGLLGRWSGDPCLPSPWERVVCEPFNGTFVITKLDLSSNGLQGSLPTIISGLAHLKELNVRRNDLMGSIPESFAFLPQLTKLCFGCNPHFDNQLPPGLSNRSNLTTDSGRCDGLDSSPSPQSSSYVFIGSVAGGSIVFTVAVGAILTFFYKKTRPNDGRKPTWAKNAVFSVPSMDDLNLKSISIQTFSLQCIEAATCKYKTLIGEGGFGSVYRGILPYGQEVAVKVRSATSTQGTREFENELNLLSAIQHENLVPLLGYCCENDQQILVYPFMSNGSLQDRLYGEASKRKSLDWQIRLSIALGAARGLLYLHTFAGRCVIHRDVKSSNILLDHSMCAKVADFGFSKYAPQEGDSGASLEVRGTAGYLDPEYYSTQHLSAKSDVFSFGVVLLEIICSREPLNIHRPRNEWSLVEWAKPFIKESRIEEIVDPSIKAGYHAEAMWRVVEVALACIEPFSAYRPCMADIVRELEDALIIENNASEYMKSIESLGGSNRFFSIDRKILTTTTTTPSLSEPSPIFSEAMAPPLPR